MALDAFDYDVSAILDLNLYACLLQDEFAAEINKVSRLEEQVRLMATDDVQMYYRVLDDPGC